MSFLGSYALANPEVVCGSSTRLRPSGFPYVASIKTVMLKKKGRNVAQLASVYKGRKLVYHQYVVRSQAGGGLIYSSPNDDFRLTLPAQADGDTLANFRAVISTRGGDTMVANGQFPCRKQDKI